MKRGGYFEKVINNGMEFLGPLVRIEDKTEEIFTTTLSPEQISAIHVKGFWQCLHDGKKCSEVKQ